MIVDQATRLVTPDIVDLAQEQFNRSQIMRWGDPVEVAVVVAVQTLLDRGVLVESEA